MEQPTPKCIRTVWDVEVIKGGCRQPWGVGCTTLSEARDLAAKRSRAGGAPVVELDWRRDIRDITDDAIYICEIRQNVAEPGWPRIFI
ncbi:MAG: hypothetical protein ACLPSW_08290 [Roseiarcus sp.]